MSAPPESKENSTSSSGVYTGTFLAIGVAIGAASGDMGLMAIFICLFMTIGIAMDSCTSKTKPSHKPTGSTTENERNKST
ncbi:hypothetical protein [Planctopirus ephydatiae]|uniref:hypothetical protein n=1 Tax=Planctopirus ephydatiae TaxID=2528019 RepID=UPI0011A40A04|nr:hypothetical protein [Planctopirus ephydatiae]